MKRILATLCAAIALMTVSLALPASAEEVSNEVPPVVTDIVVTDEMLAQGETVTGLYDSTGIQTRAANLITANSIKLTKSGNNLLVSGLTNGIDGVDKCGFSYVTLQRLVNGSWQDYAKWTELYSSSNKYSLGKSVAAAHGYTYRVICNHHAEKPGILWFRDKQDIYNETATLYF